MAAQIPVFSISSDGGLRDIIITGQSVNATTGALTDAGTAVNCTARLGGVNHSMATATKNVSAITRRAANNMAIEDDQDFSVSVMFVNSTTDVEPLRTLFLTYGVFKLTYTIGKTTNAAKGKITLFGQATGYDFGQQDKGEIIASLSFKQVDSGAAGDTLITQADGS
jgi:hypothetical protein